MWRRTRWWPCSWSPSIPARVRDAPGARRGAPPGLWGGGGGAGCARTAPAHLHPHPRAGLPAARTGPPPGLRAGLAALFAAPADPFSAPPSASDRRFPVRAPVTSVCTSRGSCVWPQARWLLFSRWAKRFFPLRGGTPLPPPRSGSSL